MKRIDVVKQLDTFKQKHRGFEYILGEFSIMLRYGTRTGILDCDRMNKCEVTQARVNFALQLLTGPNL